MPVVVVGVAIVAVYIALERRSPFENAYEEVRLVLDGGTRVAKDYSDAAFAAIAIGDTHEAVRQRVGLPLVGNDHLVMYSIPTDGATCYRLRKVYFTRGRVSRVAACFQER